jgi:hypothetical protein
MPKRFSMPLTGLRKEGIVAARKNKPVAYLIQEEVPF